MKIPRRPSGLGAVLNFFVLASGLAACDTYNSVSKDALNFPKATDTPATGGGTTGGTPTGGSGGGGGGDTTDPAVQRFTAAKAIISEKCATCHYHAGAAWNTWAEKQWIKSGLVVAGNVSSSYLFSKLANPAGGGGNMPQGGLLSQAQYDTIQEWIGKMIQ
jgi:hypothetical protein